MFHLRFDGDLVDASRRAPDGTCLNGISAIDALDGRYIQPFDLQIQMQTENMLRELNKAAAGFVCQLNSFQSCHELSLALRALGLWSRFEETS
jgi:hypothetical protein